MWGDILEFGKRAELGAEGAARTVVAEIKQLRMQAMRKRQLAPGSRSIRAARSSEAKGAHEVSGKPGDIPAVIGEEKASPPEVDHPEAWEWYVKAADQG